LVRKGRSGKVWITMHSLLFGSRESGEKEEEKVGF